MKNRKRMTKCLIVFAFAVYLLVGIFIYQDYGISADEPTERISTLVNVKYILSILNVEKAEAIDVPDLADYKDRYYGTLLQLPTSILEIKNEGNRDIYLGRHLYTFFLCLAGYVAFFFLCKTLFHSKLLGLLGSSMVALYPRFFAEQFYNIKDMVFVSVFMIAMFTTVKLIESRFSLKWLIFFSIATVVATNVRIVGVIFLILILGYLLVDFILGKVYKNNGYEVQCSHPIRCGALLLILFLIMFIITMPVTWKNPIQGIWDIFVKFSDFDEWDSTIVFMGKIISKAELPWYYVPLWILISVPVWYLLLFAVTAIFSICIGVKQIMAKNNFILLFFTKYKYVTWCVLLMAIPWLGIVVMHSTIYNGWRHCYFFLPPMILFALFGVKYLSGKGKKYVPVLLTVIILGGGCQLIWIGNNHPYEMVYFNNIGKHYGEFFDRDYWNVAVLDAFRYIAENEPNDKFSVETTGTDLYRYMLEDEERDRIIEEEEPLYFIETYRGKIGNDLKKDGYEEIHSIMVDDFKISTIYKKCSKGSKNNK